MFLAVISHAYEEQDLSTAEKPDSRVVLKFPAKLAPIKLAVLPLTKKDGLPEIAEKIMNDCKPHFRCFYEEKDSIGKRYRRMDALGTPFCVTVDHQTKEDNTVTIRHRDSMEQERVPMRKVRNIVTYAIAIEIENISRPGYGFRFRSSLSPDKLLVSTSTYYQPPD